MLIALAACAPEPKYVPCSNDGECRERGHDFQYCLESRCVECVGNSRCKVGLCVDGRCRSE